MSLRLAWLALRRSPSAPLRDNRQVVRGHRRLTVAHQVRIEAPLPQVPHPALLKQPPRLTPQILYLPSRGSSVRYGAYREFHSMEPRFPRQQPSVNCQWDTRGNNGSPLRSRGAGAGVISYTPSHAAQPALSRSRSRIWTSVSRAWPILIQISSFLIQDSSF